jgi:hypothetical protein
MPFLTGRVVILGLFLAAAAAAQQPSTQDDPLAAAARRIREQKKVQAKASKVWDNDNIPKASAAESVASPPAPDISAGSATSSGAGNPAAPAESAARAADGKAARESGLTAAKEALQNLQSDLDIMQRKLALDQQTYYGKPGYSSDKAGAAALKDEQDQIDAKQVDLGAAQKKIEDLQAALDSPSESKTSSE